jgi:hypothetical protein
MTISNLTNYSKSSLIQINLRVGGRGHPDIAIIRINEAKDSAKRHKEKNLENK